MSSYQKIVLDRLAGLVDAVPGLVSGTSYQFANVGKLVATDARTLAIVAVASFAFHDPRVEVTIEVAGRDPERFVWQMNTTGDAAVMLAAWERAVRAGAPGPVESFEVICTAQGFPDSVMGEYSSRFDADAVAEAWNRLNGKHGFVYTVVCP